MKLSQAIEKQKALQNYFISQIAEQHALQQSINAEEIMRCGVDNLTADGWLQQAIKYNGYYENAKSVAYNNGETITDESSFDKLINELDKEQDKNQDKYYRYEEYIMQVIGAKKYYKAIVDLCGENNADDNA